MLICFKNDMYICISSTVVFFCLIFYFISYATLPMLNLRLLKNKITLSYLYHLSFYVNRTWSTLISLNWLQFQVNRMGVPQENKALQSCQLMTCATD